MRNYCPNPRPLHPQHERVGIPRLQPWGGRQIKQLWILAGLATAVIPIVLVFSVLWEPDPPKPSNRDSTVEELLNPGVHCYDSPPERAAARQRALAAIDRIRWERNQPNPDLNEMWGPPPPVPAPQVWDTPGPSDDWDGALCFSISKGE